MDIAVQAGSMVLESGGETYRAEETCVRMARAMGAREASAFVTPTLVMVSVQDRDCHSHTAMRRITARTVNLRKIALLNDLSRRLAQREGGQDVAKVARMPERIDSSPTHSFWSMVVMGGFTGFFFALMFGCSFLQALCAFVIGFLLRICILAWCSRPLCLRDWILAANPSFVDWKVQSQYLHRLGSERQFYFRCLPADLSAWPCAGVGADDDCRPDAGGAGAAAALSYCFNISRYNIVWGAVVGGLGWLTYTLALPMDGGAGNSAYFFGALVVAVLSEVLALAQKKPATIYLVPGLLPLVPGGGMFETMAATVAGNLDRALLLGFSTLTSAGAIALAIALASSGARIVQVGLRYFRKK